MRNKRHQFFHMFLYCFFALHYAHDFFILRKDIVVLFVQFTKSFQYSLLPWWVFLSNIDNANRWLFYFNSRLFSLLKVNITPLIKYLVYKMLIMNWSWIFSLFSKSKEYFLVRFISKPYKKLPIVGKKNNKNLFICSSYHVFQA